MLRSALRNTIDPGEFSRFRSCHLHVLEPDAIYRYVVVVICMTIHYSHGPSHDFHIDCYWVIDQTAQILEVDAVYD